MIRRIAALALLGGAPAIAGQIQVLTYHNDLARTGQNLNETVLTPANVRSGRFGPLFTVAVDGPVYAQPLYLEKVNIVGKGAHNVVFVATEHDSVYAFDADDNSGPNAAPLWHVSFISLAAGVTAASAASLQCASIVPEVGITATPVIDAASGTLYVVAMTQEGPEGNYEHRLHALDITTGAERPGGPVEIQASLPGAGDGNTMVTFSPALYKERAGLLLVNGVVYTSWASHCDYGRYHGWIIGYDAKTLQQVAAFVSTPNWDAGAFWQGGGAPAADADGGIYVVAGNGTFDADSGGSDFGESVIKLSAAFGLSVADYFTPYNAEWLTQQDIDLGSSGALLLPDEVGSPAHPHLLITGSKEGTAYLIDRDNLGHFHSGDDSQIVQSIAPATGPLFGMPVYFNGKVYFSGASDAIKAFSISDGRLSALPVSQSAAKFAQPGAVPSISANGSLHGILWIIDSSALLHAYDAADLTTELYSGSTGTYVKFSTPTIANGKVYAGTQDSVVVFGLASLTTQRGDRFR